MTEEKKIKNAALYWYNCNKDGFPKGQKEIFEEWLESSEQHKIIYQKLFNNKDIKNIIKHPKKKKISTFYTVLTILIFIIMIITIRIYMI